MAQGEYISMVCSGEVNFERIRKNGFQGPSFCCVSRVPKENMDRTFNACSFLKETWVIVLAWFGQELENKEDVLSLLQLRTSKKFENIIVN